ncbi:MAG: penicillin-binding protein 1B [Porticoccus sp.]
MVQGIAKKGRSKSNISNKDNSRLAWIWRMIIFILVATTIFLVIVDVFVYKKFVGKKWSLPSHVYSRPLELYQGLSLSRQLLEWELKELGYKKVDAAKAPGQFSVSEQSVEFFSRGFEFWDEREPSKLMIAIFSGDKISGLKDSHGRVIAITRLEPMMIGGIYPSRKEDRQLVKLDKVPPTLAAALVAIEDQDFYRHQGVSFRGITRAFLANMTEGKIVQGGSTITQQLVKNFYLNERRTLSRKALEAIMAVLLEIHFTKQEILETYINEVYLGQSGDRAIHGFEMASNHYFNQPVQELQLHQTALLAGLVKGASFYNPWRHPKRALNRRNLVLDVMNLAGVISRVDATTAKAKPLAIISPISGRSHLKYPSYLTLVKRQLRQTYKQSDLQTAGLRIFTNFDPQIQRKVEDKIAKRIENLESGYGIEIGKLQSASVIARVGSGEVVAVSGDRKPGFDGFNRALDARRPVGSTIKPAVYLAALENPESYTLNSKIEDTSISVSTENGDIWQPRNFGRKSHGLIPLYEGLGYSYNQATARLGMNVGLPAVIDSIKRLGYSRPLPRLPSLLLGSIEMSPIELAQMYHTIAANGFYSPLRAISSVFTAENIPLKRYHFEAEQRFDNRVMHLISYGLQVVLREGTGKSAYQRLPEELLLAGKTGTTNDQRDSWFAGFSGNYLSVVWMGRDDNGKTPLTGGSGALRLWIDIMVELENRSLVFQKPDGVNYYWVSSNQNGCHKPRYLPFIAGSEPDKRESCASKNDTGVLGWFSRNLDW